MKVSISAAVALVLTALLWAAPARADTEYDQCIDRTATNSEWGECGDAFLARLDAALNVAWKKANASVEKSSRRALLEEQRAWLKFRGSSCRVWADRSFGREGQVLHFFVCRAGIIEARISYLSYLHAFGR